MTETLYFFDCLDGIIGGRYWRLDDLKAEMLGEDDPREYTERDAVLLAQNIEAILYRYEVENGEEVDSATLYDPWDCFG